MIEVSKFLPLPHEVVWEYLTDSDKSALWYGPVDLFPDGRFRVKLLHEEGQPYAWGKVLWAQPLKEILLLLGEGEQAWEVSVALCEAEGGTHISLTQAETTKEETPWIIAGWKYYADCLHAAMTGLEQPNFAFYAPQT